MTGTKESGDGNIRKDFPGGWKNDSLNAFTAAGSYSHDKMKHGIISKNYCSWRKQNKAVTEGSLIHYTPGNNGCYVYARIKDDKTAVVILNGTDKDQLLSMDRFSDIIGSHTRGIDVITGQELDVTTQINVPARGVFVLDLK